MAKSTKEAGGNQQGARGLTRFMVSDGNGGAREATDRDLALISIGLEWAACGIPLPPEVMARAAAAYDRAACDEAAATP